jgi:hypothetical protein
VWPPRSLRVLRVRRPAIDPGNVPTSPSVGCPTGPIAGPDHRPDRCPDQYPDHRPAHRLDQRPDHRRSDHRRVRTADDPDRRPEIEPLSPRRSVAGGVRLVPGSNPGRASPRCGRTAFARAATVTIFGSGRDCALRCDAHRRDRRGSGRATAAPHSRNDASAATEGAGGRSPSGQDRRIRHVTAGTMPTQSQAGEVTTPTQAPQAR